VSVDSITLETYLQRCFGRAGDKYRGQWHFDSGNNCWIGNPCRAAEVDDMLEACKHKAGADSERNHSRAMTLPDMEKLLTHSRNACPVELDHDSVTAKANHLWFNTFTSTGFTIWTRSIHLAF